ncbi:MAG TPA: YncE family protein [Bryobacteraceae bacterium]|nr:YncE family protein [Bryobacteraceae bacterium]
MAGKLITRRSVLAASLFSACARKRAPRYSGWLFVASADERGIAVADLAEFRRVTTIALPYVPRQILRAEEKVFVTCPEGRAIFEIDPMRFAMAGRINVPGRIVSAVVTPDGKTLAVAADEPPALHLFEAASRRPVAKIPLPGVPLALHTTDDIAAVATSENKLERAALKERKLRGATALGLSAGIVRFRPDGKAILIGADDRNQIVTLDAGTGALQARLPIAFAPRRFCFSADNGGQMFVTGSGGDSIVVVSPYQSEVYQTMVGGRNPGSMAVGALQNRDLLFVADAGSADLTIFDIFTKGLASSIQIGGKPGEVLITPGGGYALVLDSVSGDVSVVRTSVALSGEPSHAMGQGAKPLFTVFPTGGGPQDAAIIPRAA